MKRWALICLWLCCTFPGLARALVSGLWAANLPGDEPVILRPGDAGGQARDLPPEVLPTQAPLPRMAPEYALQVFEGHAAMQSAELVGYSATTLIRAQLPATSQYGEYELQRHYSAPRTLVFKALRFTGDTFVKNNVIARLLQQEVDHVQKDDPALTAISSANYKFSYKGTADLGGRVVHVFHIKPRQKRPGLFKGKICLDAYTGTLARAEGKLVKSPSFFVKKIEFVQDYADIKSFTFPVHIHSEAQTRVVGPAVVDVYQRDYQLVSASTQAQNLQSGN
jgi:hypothetical protein